MVVFFFSPFSFRQLCASFPPTLGWRGVLVSCARSVVITFASLRCYRSQKGERDVPNTCLIRNFKPANAAFVLDNLFNLIRFIALKEII